jgi:hypothetical protein
VLTPILIAVVAILARAGLAWQRGLTWTEYRAIHGLRRRAFAALDPTADDLGRSLVNEKGGRDDPEYLATVSGSVTDVVGVLRAGGATLHLLSTVKRRPDGSLSAAHLVWTHADGQQTEAYLFANDDGTVGIYAHIEASVTDPENHVGGDEQRPGDPRGVVADALAATSVDELALDPTIARHVPPE